MRAAALVMLIATAAQAAEVEILGPEGPLSAEALTVPGARHAVVIIPGSGPTDRDGNGPFLQTDMYRLLAEELAAQGVASLRIDKRGMFASRAAVADANAVTLGDYAADARAWVEEAASLAPCVWLAGHSEGGLVAMAAAAEPPPALCGLILLATPGRPLDEVLLEQLAANPAMFALLPQARRIVETLAAGEVVPTESIPLLLRPLFLADVQPFLISLFTTDPASLAAAWPGPALVVHAGRDIQVTGADADVLESALSAGTRADLPLATHTLKEDVPGAPLATYSDPLLPLAPGLTAAILGFLEIHPPP
jgi:uncharacterized protein